MATITRLSIWRDVGYTEGAVEVPSETSSLPTPTITVADVHPSASNLFSELRLRVPFEDVYNCTYLKAEYDMNNGDDVVMYGWIDDVSISSDNPSNPVTVIRWHIDMWRTYLARAEFGSGVVSRRSGDPVSFDQVPPMKYPERYRTASKVMSIIPDKATWWVIFNCTVTIGSGSLSCMGTFPVNIRSLSTTRALIWGKDPAGKLAGRVSPNINDIIRGNVDEILAIDPSTVSAMWISPIPPFAFTFKTGTMAGDIGWGTDDDSWWLYTGKADELFDLDYGFLIRVGEADPYEETTSVPNGVSIATHDVRELVVTGFDGEVVGHLPWGKSFTTVSTRTIVDSVSAYLEMRFNTNTQAILNNAENMTVQIPLIALPLTQNSWSSYVYSGARDTDIQQRANQYTNALLSSALSAGQNPVGTGMSLLETAQQGRLTDMAHRNVSNSMALYGTGFDVLYYGQTPALVALTMDSYSQSQRTNDINIYGVHVDEPMSSCQSLIDKGGPLQISNLTVKGAIPNTARQYFRDRFANGVRIV